MHLKLCTVNHFRVRPAHLLAHILVLVGQTLCCALELKHAVRRDRSDIRSE